MHPHAPQHSCSSLSIYIQVVNLATGYTQPLLYTANLNSQATGSALRYVDGVLYAVDRADGRGVYTVTNLYANDTSHYTLSALINSTVCITDCVPYGSIMYAITLCDFWTNSTQLDFFDLWQLWAFNLSASHNNNMNDTSSFIYNSTVIQIPIPWDDYVDITMIEIIQYESYAALVVQSGTELYIMPLNSSSPFYANEMQLLLEVKLGCFVRIAWKESMRELNVIDVCSALLHIFIFTMEGGQWTDYIVKNIPLNLPCVSKEVESIVLDVSVNRLIINCLATGLWIVLPVVNNNNTQFHNITNLVFPMINHEICGVSLGISTAMLASNSLLYASCANGIVRMSTQGGNMISIADALCQPVDIQLNTNTGDIYILCTGSGLMYVDGTSSLLIPDTYTCVSQYFADPGSYLAIDSIHNEAFLACGNATLGIRVVAANNYEVIQRVAISYPCTPVALLYDNSTSTLLQQCANGTIIQLDIETNELTILFDDATGAVCGGNNGAMALDIHRRLLYLTCADVICVNLTDGINTVHTILSADICLQSTSLALDSDGTTLYVSCVGYPIGGIAAINLLTGAYYYIMSADECLYSFSVVYEPMKNNLYATCSGSNAAAVVMYDLNTHAIVSLSNSIECPSPFHISVDSASQLIYVACASGGALVIAGNYSCPIGYYYAGGCVPCTLQTYRDYAAVTSEQYAVSCKPAPNGTVVNCNG